jgi:hypothetical protein
MVSFVLLVTLQTKTVNYDIFRGDDQIGEAKILIRIIQDGGKRSDAKLTLHQNGKKLDMHTTQIWAFSGRPVLKIVQVFDEKGVETSRTRIDFRSNDAGVTKTVGDKITKSTVAIDAKAEIRDLTEFWFIRDEPQKGKPYQYLTFDSTALIWQPTKSTFVGVEEKEIRGQKKKLSHISQEIGAKHVDIWLDSEGFPVATEASDKTKIVAKF